MTTVIAHSNVLVKVVLNSGNKAVYDVQPQHVPSEDRPESYHYPWMYGRQIAHEFQGKWYHGSGHDTFGSWTEITDPDMIDALNSVWEPK